MNALAQYDLGGLLEQAGAVPPRHGRGKWTCPECGRPALSVNLDKGVFHCHHAGCTFRGGIGALRKRLGIARQWLPQAEYIRQQQALQRVQIAAQNLADAVRTRRAELIRSLSYLHTLERKAHRLGPDSAGAWEVLAEVHRAKPGLMAELAFLESAHARMLLRFLAAPREQREAVNKAIVEQGGLYDFAGKFVEVNP